MLADQFQEILDSLPDDWTDLTLDMRYSKADWHWRLIVANKFGHAAAAPTVKGTLALLDQEGIEAELILRDFREGRAEVTQMWGRPESVRKQFRASRRL